MRIAAATELLETEDIVNDPVNSRHTATLTGLAPETAYVYSVGDVWSGTWSELREFTTAPAGERPFSFVYLGDAQNGLERWGSVVRKARRRHPEAAFYLLAGDLVNRGQQRQEWDVFFREAQDVYDTRPLVPAPGNHDYDEGSPELYLRLFDLPENGPVSIGPERAYALRYGGALFLMLDSNQPPETQAGWIEEQLADTDATWKFACFHHPVYSSSPTRDNPEIREVWGPLFDEYHVDMVFQGHDHGYLRTHPMKAERVAESPGEGTIYVVSMSGTKKYDQGDFDYAAKAVKDTPTYQVIDILTTGHRLAYRAYDVDGNLIDEVVIEK
jgi:hypothetical protein